MEEIAAEHRERHAQLSALAGKVELLDPAWSCVVRFYASMHLITAYLIMKSNVRFDPASESHHGRKAALDKCPELRHVAKAHRALKDLSEQIRYDPGYVYTAKNHTDSKKYLATVDSIVEPLLKTLLKS